MTGEDCQRSHWPSVNSTIPEEPLRTHHCCLLSFIRCGFIAVGCGSLGWIGGAIAADTSMNLLYLILFASCIVGGCCMYQRRGELMEHAVAYAPVIASEHYAGSHWSV